MFTSGHIRHPEFTIYSGHLIIRVVKDKNPRLHGSVVDTAQTQGFSKTSGMIEFLHMLGSLDQVDIERLGPTIGHHVMQGIITVFKLHRAANVDGEGLGHKTKINLIHHHKLGRVRLPGWWLFLPLHI